MRRVVVAFAFALLVVVPGGGGKAADLRITFAELTEIVRRVAGDTKIYLNNVPGPLGGLFASGSSVTVAGTQHPLPVPAKSFKVGTSQYVYYVNDISSKSLRIVPIKRGLRLIMDFEDERPELLPGCLSGPCNFTKTLPNIEWPGAGVRIDMVPIQFNGSLALKINRVRIVGSPRAVCQSDAGFFSSSACRLGRPWANRTIRQIKPEIERTIRDKVNSKEIQIQLADGLKKFLSVGPAGVIAVNNLFLDPKSLTVKFNFAVSGG